MPYAPQTWTNGSGGGTPLSAARLTYMETGIDDAHVTADAALVAASNLSDLANAATARTNLGLGALAVEAAVTSALITDGTIVDGDINAAAAIALSKLATDPLARANHTGTQLAATISDFDTQVRTSRLDQMAVPTASVSMNSQKITSLADGAAAADAVNKGQLDLMLPLTGGTLTGDLTIDMAAGSALVTLDGAAASTTWGQITGKTAGTARASLKLGDTLGVTTMLLYDEQNTRNIMQMLGGAAAAASTTFLDKLVVQRGSAGQTADLQQWNDHSGTVLSAVQKDGSVLMTEQTAPSAPAANKVVIYAVDNGAGKTQLMALFSSGAAQQLAIEP